MVLQVAYTAMIPCMLFTKCAATLASNRSLFLISLPLTAVLQVPPSPHVSITPIMHQHCTSFTSVKHLQDTPVLQASQTPVVVITLPCPALPCPALESSCAALKPFCWGATAITVAVVVLSSCRNAVVLA